MRGAAVLVAGGLVAAACGGDGAGSRDDGGNGVEQRAVDEDQEGTTSTTDADDARWGNIVRGPQVSDEEPVRGSSIVVALEAETNSYLPSASTASRAGANVAYAVFDPLVTRDANGELRPYLAEAVEPNGDYTEWTLRLRPGVRFHDGTPLDAEALERIWDDYLTTGPVTRSATRFVERMERVDELTVTYVMTEPNPSFPELLELQIGWPFSPDAADRLGDEFGERPVGTGPFRFVSWQRDGDLVVERNDDYWQDGQPYLDEITFRVIPDEATRAASLASGDVDAVQTGELSSFVAQLADIDDATVVLGLGHQASGVRFNTTEPPTDDVRIRRALTHAVDQQALLEVAAGEAAELSEVRTQFFPADSPFYSDAVADAWPRHDPARARQLYNDYVDDPGRSDGKAVGQPVSLTLDTLNTPSAIELGNAYKGFFEAVGFDVTVQPLELSQRTMTAVTDNYQAQIGIQGRAHSPLGEFLFAYDDPERVITNLTNFHDEKVADVIARLRITGDPDRQAELAEEFGLYLAEQVPFQWTASDLTLVAAKNRVRGLRSWTFPDGTLGDGVLPSVAFWGQVWLGNDTG